MPVAAMFYVCPAALLRRQLVAVRLIRLQPDVEHQHPCVWPTSPLISCTSSLFAVQLLLRDDDDGVKVTKKKKGGKLKAGQKYEARSPIKWSEEMQEIVDGLIAHLKSGEVQKSGLIPSTVELHMIELTVLRLQTKQKKHSRNSILGD